MNTASLASVLTATAALTGCYVVPIHPPAPAPHVVHVPAPQPPAPLTFSARLYPANDLAASHGMVAAVVTNELNGKGHFTTNIGGENFTGEATRNANARDGLANGAGNRGGYISCRYTMNTTTQGTGTCRLASGALFTMHVGH
jgi:hypothetical protein